MIQEQNLTQSLHIRKTSDGFCVEGSGIPFHVSCDTYEDAVLVAKRTQEKFYPSALVIDDALEDEVRRERLQKRSDWNEQAS